MDACMHPPLPNRLHHRSDHGPHHASSL